MVMCWNRKDEVFYSGITDKHAFWTIFVVTLRRKEGVMDFQPINKKCHVTLINVHATTEEMSDKKKTFSMMS